jgi:hypothetical protein
MRLIAAATAALVMASAHTAAAQEPACSVTFVRAPDDVRHVIERWLAAEPRCVSTIELRVLPTDDGFYLLAQRPDGHIHERIVPDATAAAVIVASWVADDWTSAPSRPLPTTPAPTIERVVETPAPSVVVHVEPRDSGSGRWLTVGPLLSMSSGGGYGARVELDVLGSGPWTAGLALLASTSVIEAHNVYGTSYMHVADVELLATVSRVFTSGRWSLRPTFGLGAAYTDAGTQNDIYDNNLGWPQNTPWPDDVMTGGTTLSVVTEGSLMLARRFGDRWAASVGPIATYLDQDIQSNNSNAHDFERTSFTVMLFGGVKYRL